jgi:acetolactate synthase regulatory subunit
MSTTTTTVLVVLRDDAHALGRLLALCHRRGWRPVSLRSVSDGHRCEVTMRLRVPGDRRGDPAHVQAQLARLVDVVDVALDTADGLPDDVAFAAVRRKAPWSALAA